jgi:hypothetical protein
VTGQSSSDETVGPLNFGGAECNFEIRSGEFAGAMTYLVWNPGTNGESCYSNDDNVCEVYGAIGEEWAELVSDYEEVGLPIDEEYTDGTNIRRQDFQNMYITWNATNGNLCSYFRDGSKYSGPC